jgi:hypothetical protein
MGYRPRYDKGNWKAVCDVCGKLFKADQLSLRWDNLRVCPDDYETRQPQDFIRGKVDIQIPIWIRPQPEDNFISDSLCGTLESTAVPGLSHPGCMRPSVKVPSWYVGIPPSTFTE